MECIKETNLSLCTCTYMACNKRGKCCECVSYHRKNNEIPGCFFPSSIEKTYDRSVKRFISAFGMR